MTPSEELEALKVENTKLRLERDFLLAKLRIFAGHVAAVPGILADLGYRKN